jgi:hypothetical protein
MTFLCQFSVPNGSCGRLTFGDTMEAVGTRNARPRRLTGASITVHAHTAGSAIRYGMLGGYLHGDSPSHT